MLMKFASHILDMLFFLYFEFAPHFLLIFFICLLLSLI